MAFRELLVLCLACIVGLLWLPPTPSHPVRPQTPSWCVRRPAAGLHRPGRRVDVALAATGHTDSLDGGCLGVRSCFPHFFEQPTSPPSPPLLAGTEVSPRIPKFFLPAFLPRKTSAFSVVTTTSQSISFVELKKTDDTRS